MPPGLADFLKAMPYFRALSADEIAAVARETAELSFAKGEILFLAGEPCRGLYIVQSGQIRVYKSSPEGREQVLTIANPGDSFNDVPIFDDGPNPASASSIEASTIYLIPKGAVLALIKGCPTARAMLQAFARRLRYLSTMVEDLSFRSVVSRLAKLLLDQAVAEGSVSPVKRLTQDEMAAMVGSVRDVVGRALKHLEKVGAIRIEGHRILVIAPGRLREML